MSRWEAEKQAGTTGWRQYRQGLTVGLFIALGILLTLISGWYTRANMVANSGNLPLVLTVSFVGIAGFCAVFYSRYKKEMNEQRYRELLAKKQKLNSTPSVQQDM